MRDINIYAPTGDAWDLIEDCPDNELYDLIRAISEEYDGNHTLMAEFIISQIHGRNHLGEVYVTLQPVWIRKPEDVSSEEVLKPVRTELPEDVLNFIEDYEDNLLIQIWALSELDYNEDKPLNFIVKYTQDLL